MHPRPIAGPASTWLPEMMQPRPTSRSARCAINGVHTTALALTARMSACATRPAALKWSFSSCLRGTNHTVVNPQQPSRELPAPQADRPCSAAHAPFSHNLLAAQELAQPRCPPAVNPSAHLPRGIEGQVAHIHPPAHGGALTPAAKAAACGCRGGQEGDDAKAGN